MKKRISAGAALLTIAGISLLQAHSYFVRQIRWYDFDPLPIGKNIDFPIESAHNAAIYAKTSGKYSLDVANQQFQDQGIAADWRIRVEQYAWGKGNWTVLIVSRGILPSYSCQIEFQPDGTWVLWDKCAWNK